MYTVPDTDDTCRRLLWNWHLAIRICHKAHIKAAAFLHRSNRRFGVPVVILSTVTGASVFATIESSPDVRIRIAVGLVSVTAGVLAGLQTFLGHADRAETHRVAAQRYGALRRELEEVLHTCTDLTVLPEGYLADIRMRWDEIDKDSPSLSQALYERVARSVRKKRESGGEFGVLSSPPIV
ncbi:MAG: SLATT domain-containing protein [Candidatus Krumholzibacteriota bacterium]|nr:SLATT domain-containing protein [Candidatus Krumholzibacteriota bacterium]